MDLSIRSQTFAADDQSWLGSARGTSSAQTVTLDVSTFTAGTHYPDGFLPSGLPLMAVAAGKVGLFVAGAEGSEGILAGFLLSPVKAGASNTVDVVGAMLDHGRIVVANLPIAFVPANVLASSGQFIYV